MIDLFSNSTKNKTIILVFYPSLLEPQGNTPVSRAGSGLLSSRSNFPTGFGGFSLWRFQAPVPEKTAAELSLAEDMDALIQEFGGNWFILLKELNSRTFYSRKARAPIHPAPVIKVPIAMLFIKSIEPGEGHYEKVLQRGLGGRSIDQLMKAMLVYSEEEATETIVENLSKIGYDVPQVLKEWGAESTDIIKRISTVRDMAVLFEGLYGSYLAPEARGLILDYLSQLTPGDNTRWGVLRKYQQVSDSIL